MSAGPVAASARIESLDVLRGFAVLGILLLNILGFGFHSGVYSNPANAMTGLGDVLAWAGVELLAEGAMRCLFSMLFGAGIVLFATGANAKSARLHYRRTFWLLVIGLFDVYVLLWSGDILVNYALAGAVLFWVRNASASRLLACGLLLIAFMSLMYFAMNYSLAPAQAAADEVAAAADPHQLSPEVREAARQWQQFAQDFQPDSSQIATELAQRRASYASAFVWNIQQASEMLLVVLPLFLFWDALAMMLLGMALYKYGVLQGTRDYHFYFRLMVSGFFVGLLVNSYEVGRAVADEFALLSVFAQMQPTYHLGRLGMALGYIGLFFCLAQWGIGMRLRQRLAAAGRMALTNYLLQSLICAVLFTGLGFSLVGELLRWQSYGVVITIWLLQLWFSTWWMDRYRFGPAEWLWRGLTYGKLPRQSRSSDFMPPGA